MNPCYNQSFISIIIPAFNCEPYIKACLLSAMNQDFPSYEIVFIDDASTDSTCSIAENTLQQSIIPSRIIRNATNRGVSATRNIGIRQARGKYLFFLDGDDAIAPETLSALFKATLSDKEHILMPIIAFSTFANDTDLQHSMDTSHPSPTFQAFPPYQIMGNLRHGYVWGCLILRHLVLRNNIWFDEKLNYREDNVWLAHYCSYVDQLVAISSKMYYYRNTPSSLSSQNPVLRTIQAFVACSMLIQKLKGRDLSVYYSIRRKLLNSAFAEWTISPASLRKRDLFEHIRAGQIQGGGIWRSHLTFPSKLLESLLTYAPRIHHFLILSLLRIKRSKKNSQH